MKKLVSSVLAASMVLSLAACGGDTQSTDTDADTSGDESASGSQTYTVGIIQQVQHEALDAATQGFQDALTELLRENRFAPIIAHAPYTLNACALDEGLRAFARDAMREDVMTLDTYLPHMLYNFHPGSHVGQGSETGIALIADGLNAILRPNQATTVLLETMAGKGSEVGGRFEELRAILDRVELSGKVGVCLDTCHVSDGGYDIVHDLDGVLTEFDSIIGLRRLKAIHLNDSKNPPGSRKDRHACLGEGTIGLEALGRIVRHPALKDLPFCLETPNDLPGYAREIALMREMAEA